jgi:hypothetical protein
MPKAWLTIAPLKTYWQYGSTQQRIIAQALEALERRREVGASDVVGHLGTQFDKGQDHGAVFCVVGHLRLWRFADAKCARCHLVRRIDHFGRLAD